MMAVAVQKKPEPQAPMEWINYPSRRFGLPDLPARGEWLLKRLQERYPHLGDVKVLAAWLRGMVDSNTCQFLCTDRAVAMATVEHPTLASQPDILERFVLCEDGAVDEAVSLYADLFRWGQMLGADKFVVDFFTDVPRELIKQRLGRLWPYEDVYVKLTPVLPR